MLLELRIIMVENKLKVLITTSGLGTRLGDLTKYTNKALVKLGDKAVISHIIDAYPNAEFVITLGHFGDFVRQFLEITYPELKFEFVYVDKYCGEGSGLVKSISFAKDKLQCPFIFNVCDTILTDTIINVDHNWMACGKSYQPDVFRTVRTDSGNITKINEKGEINYDYAYVGVAGIFDYELFWKTLDLMLLDEILADSSDCHIFMNMLKKVEIGCFEVSTWFDTGSVEHLNKAKTNYIQKYKVLDKHEESIYFIDNAVIKFFNDSNLCTNRVKRATVLDGLIPKVIKHSDNFYKYELVDGDLLSNVITESKLKNLISWAETNLWTPVDVDKSIFMSRCKNFYITKTKQRIQQYLISNSLYDRSEKINNVEVPSCEDLLNMINWENMCLTEPVNFHGDFILDNILYKDGFFMLLDWRQDFGGEIIGGDKYYDLSKLNHNLTINHEMLHNNYYFINKTKDNTCCDIFRSQNMVQCQQTLINVLEQKGIDTNKVKILTSIIWLNMAPLHVYPLNNFLFYFGKYNLWREICSIKY